MTKLADYMAALPIDEQLAVAREANEALRRELKQLKADHKLVVDDYHWTDQQLGQVCGALAERTLELATARATLAAIEQRANESRNGPGGERETIHAMYALAVSALAAEDKP